MITPENNARPKPRRLPAAVKRTIDCIARSYSPEQIWPERSIEISIQPGLPRTKKPVRIDT